MSHSPNTLDNNALRISSNNNDEYITNTNSPNLNPTSPKSPTSQSTSRTSYTVFHVYYHGSPDHQALFIETHEAGTYSGHLYHVIGNVLTGMSYNDRAEPEPETTAEFHMKYQIGRVKQSDYGLLGAICKEIVVPGRQLDLRGRKLDDSKPLRKCGEWLADAVSELMSRGVLTV